MEALASTTLSAQRLRAELAATCRIVEFHTAVIKKELQLQQAKFNEEMVEMETARQDSAGSQLYSLEVRSNLEQWIEEQRSIELT